MAPHRRRSAKRIRHRSGAHASTCTQGSPPAKEQAYNSAHAQTVTNFAVSPARRSWRRRGEVPHAEPHAALRAGPSAPRARVGREPRRRRRGRTPARPTPARGGPIGAQRQRHEARLRRGRHGTPVAARYDRRGGRGSVLLGTLVVLRADSSAYASGAYFLLFPPLPTQRCAARARRKRFRHGPLSQGRERSGRHGRLLQGAFRRLHGRLPPFPHAHSM